MRSKDLNEVTHPGNVPGEPSVLSDDASEPDEDEFPSEATRIDPSFLSAAPTPQRPKAAGSLEALAASRSQVRQEAPTPQPQRERAAPAPRNHKLAALQSLSLDGGGGGGGTTRLPPAPRNQGGSKLPWAILFLLAAGFGGNALWEKFHHAETTHPGQPAIRTEVVSLSGGTGQTFVAAGYTAARDPISIGAPSGGQVKEVKVQVNDRVTKGQVIVNLDSSAAEAELSAVHTEVNEMEGAYRQQEMLFKAGAATIVAVSQARSLIALARAKARAPEQKIAQAHVRTLTSGTVLEVLVHPGETIAPNGPVVKVADLHNLTADVDVPEADIVKIHRGQQVEVTAEAFPGKTFKGSVYVISEQADKSRGTVQVRVDLVVTEDLLKTNMSVKCTFLPPQGEAPRLFVSRSAITAQGNVFVVGSNHVASARPVKVGTAQGTSMEIVTGLTAGEQIVSDALSVHDGQQLPQ